MCSLLVSWFVCSCVLFVCFLCLLECVSWIGWSCFGRGCSARRATATPTTPRRHEHARAAHTTTPTSRHSQTRADDAGAETLRGRHATPRKREDTRRTALTAPDDSSDTAARRSIDRALRQIRTRRCGSSLCAHLARLCAVRQFPSSCAALRAASWNRPARDNHTTARLQPATAQTQSPRQLHTDPRQTLVWPPPPRGRN